MQRLGRSSYCGTVGRGPESRGSSLWGLKSGANLPLLHSSLEKKERTRASALGFSLCCSGWTGAVVEVPGSSSLLGSVSGVPGNSRDSDHLFFPSGFSSKWHAGGRMPTKLLCKKESRLRVCEFTVFRSHAGATVCFPGSASSSELGQYCFCCSWFIPNQEDRCVLAIFDYFYM